MIVLAPVINLVLNISSLKFVSDLSKCLVCDREVTYLLIQPSLDDQSIKEFGPVPSLSGGCNETLFNRIEAFLDCSLAEEALGFAMLLFVVL